MPQNSLNDPLDGAEKKAIILKRISDALDRDCTLVNDIAHPGFSLTFTITLKYLRTVGADSTVVWGESKVGPQPTIADLVTQGVASEAITGTYETDSPNRAREDHDLGIPVMVQTPAGSERRKVKLPRPVKKEPTPQTEAGE